MLILGEAVCLVPSYMCPTVLGPVGAPEFDLPPKGRMGTLLIKAFPSWDRARAPGAPWP